MATAIKRYVSAPVREGAALARVSYLQLGGLTVCAFKRNWRDGVSTNDAPATSDVECGFHRVEISTRYRGRASLRKNREAAERSRSVFGSLRRSRSARFARSRRPSIRARAADPARAALGSRCVFFSLHPVHAPVLALSSPLNRSGLTNPCAISILWVHIPPHKYIS